MTALDITYEDGLRLSELMGQLSDILCELDKLKDDEDGLLEYLDSDLGYYITNNTVGDFEGVMIDLTQGGPRSGWTHVMGFYAVPEAWNPASWPFQVR